MNATALAWVSTVVRLGLAAVFFFAAVPKLTEPRQAAQAVQAYQILPPQLAAYVGYGLPLIELALAVLLLLGLGTRLAALASGALFTAFVVGVISAWARGLSIDCGCFGGGGEVPEGEANYAWVLVRDAGFVLMAGWLVAFPASRLALDPSGLAGLGDPDVAELKEGSRDDGYGLDQGHEELAVAATVAATVDAGVNAGVNADVNADVDADVGDATDDPDEERSG